LKTNSPNFGRRIGFLLLLLVVAAALLLNVLRAAQLGVFHNAPIWVLHAVPAALTQMYAKSTPRYTISTDIHDAYFAAPWQPPGSRAEINKAISKISTFNFDKAKSSYVLLPGDDKGIVDFVELSFRAFAPRIEAVATLYYVLLSISVLLFLWRYWNRPVAVASVACVLFSMYQFLPTIVFNPQLTSPLALRSMPLLSIVACLHCAYFCWKPGATISDVAAVLIQASLIAFMLHIRATTVWQIYLVFFIAMLALLIHWQRSRKKLEKFSVRNVVLPVLPAMALLAAVGVLNVYRHAVFSQEYLRGEEIVTRPIWHNVYSGFALHPTFAEQESLRIDDMSVIAAVGRYLKKEGRQALWREIGGESPGFNRIKWAKYDPLVREMLIATCKAHLIMCAETFFRYKPVHFVDTLMWLYGLRGTPEVADAFVSKYFGDVGKQQIIAADSELSKRRLSAAPWASGFLFAWLAITVGIVLTGTELSFWELGCLSSVAIVSLLPSILGYPAPLGMSDSGVAISATLQIVAVLLAVWLIGLTVQRDRRSG
jgi:hypothetical protein